VILTHSPKHRFIGLKGLTGHDLALLRLVTPQIIQAQFTPILVKNLHVRITALDQRQHVFQRGLWAVSLIAIFPKGSSRCDDISHDDPRTFDPDPSDPVASQNCHARDMPN
jgi:hypothetical protein